MNTYKRMVMTAFACVASCFVLLPVCAQSASGAGTASRSSATNAKAPVAPVAPKMPSVTVPTVGGGFYMPGSSNFYGPASLQNPAQGSASKANAAASSAGESQNAESAAVSQTVQSSLQSLSSSMLSAGDLNMLQGQGVLGSLSGILSKNTATSDNALLQQILKELSALKETVALQNAQAAVKDAQKAQAVAVPAVAAKSENPKILRFLLNGQDVLSLCHEVHFSTQESDGTFLLTGDCRYTQDSQPQTESFYLLFHAKGSTSGTTRYEVTPTISKNAQTESSVLYQLLQPEPFYANRTGNLVVIHEAKPECTVDILLSLDK